MKLHISLNLINSLGMSAASGAARESVIITPLMEFVRSRRAAKSAPQRGMSGGGKSSARSGGPAASTYSLSSQKRTSEKGRAGSMMVRACSVCSCLPSYPVIRG